ncbi:unnamed protein product [Phyllotreta striolata]|uniref:Uncharacterized protein n=1 Tax=Phyllotreta striolata TaxID=444603 RepID=A0A9N9XQ03_PHYSR|nr:unnamed protein product [Phyllotreta striolata]
MTRNNFFLNVFSRNSRNLLRRSKKSPKSFNVRTLASQNDANSNIMHSESSDVDIPNVTIPEFILPSLERFEKYVASECATTGRTYTFGQIRGKSKNLNKALRHAFKLQKGDVVGILLPNCPEFGIAVLGVLEAGLTITTMNPIYTPVEISKQLLDSNTKVLITQAQAISTAKAALQLAKKDIPIVAIKRYQNDSLPSGVVDFEELVNNEVSIPDVPYVNSNDIAVLPYSSGTTGLPKGVELTHYSIISNISQISHEDFNFYDITTDNYQDVSVTVLPYFHIYGFALNLLNMMHKGCKTVTLEKFSPEIYVSVLKKHRPSLLYVAPPLVLFLISHSGVKSEYFDRLKMLMSAAAPLGLTDEERFIRKVRKEINMCQGYGLTEASPVITMIPNKTKRSEKNSGGVGKVLPNTLVKFINPEDPSGTPIAAYEKGELLMKGPQVMKGYHNREEETKKAFLDGWLRTGDIGYYNDENVVFITDRIKELIKVKGYQVAPAELEAIIRDHPLVDDAAVIGIPHPQHGEVPRAYVVPKKNSALDEENVQNHVADKVASYKRLQGGVRILESIPKNTTGKILRRQLKENFAEKGF